MRHNGNDGRNGTSDLSRFPVSVSVSYTIYMSRRKLNTVTKPALILPKESDLFLHIFKNLARF